MGIRTGLPETTAGFAVAGLFVATGTVAEAGRFVVEGAAVTG